MVVRSRSGLFSHLRTTFFVVGCFVIASCAKFSASENGNAQAQLDAAYQNLSFLAFDVAEGQFDRILQNAPAGGDLWLQAMIGKATCVNQRVPSTADGIAQANELYQQIVTQSPKSLYAARAWICMGRNAELRNYRDQIIDLPGARANYQKVVDGWPTDPIAGEAALHVAATYIQTFDTAQVQTGVAVLTNWLKTHPSDPLASVMYTYLADTYFFPLEEYDHAIDAYETADKLGWVEKSNIASTYWRVARIADERAHRPEIAAKYYARIVHEFPNSGKAYESKLALQRLGQAVAMNHMGNNAGNTKP